MHLLCLGLSHHTAPVAIREKLNYSPRALTSALARLGCGHGAGAADLAELVILSTCNRLELYAAAPHEAAAFATLLDFLEETRGVPRAEFAEHLYRLAGVEAVTHLSRVAAGLDSMILGEPQVLGQVAEALQAAPAQLAAGPILSAAFRAALRAGKRARAETAISRNPATVSSMAVKLAETAAGGLAARSVVIVGAGEIAELAAEALRARGVSQLVVVNRTLARAAQLAERWGARALTFERLGEALAEADIVLSSTDAPHFVISADLARAALARRPDRPLVFIDIAVPRDVDPGVRQLPGAHYFDIDDLAARLNGALRERQQEVPRVEAIVAEEASIFLDWLRSLEVAPLISSLRAKAKAIRRAEVEKTLRRLPRLTEAERRQIETMTEALVSKLLHAPTQRLKAENQQDNPAHYAATVRDLFALSD